MTLTLTLELELELELALLPSVGRVNHHHHHHYLDLVQHGDRQVIGDAGPKSNLECEGSSCSWLASKM